MIAGCPNSYLMRLSFLCCMTALATGCGEDNNDVEPVLEYGVNQPSGTNKGDSGNQLTQNTPEMGVPISLPSWQLANGFDFHESFEPEVLETLSPMPELAPVVVENCIAVSQGTVSYKDKTINYDGSTVGVSGTHHHKERCITALSLQLTKNGKCPLLIEFVGSMAGSWVLQKATLKSDKECGDGWGSGKTYVAQPGQSQVTMLGAPDPVHPGVGSQSCTPLGTGIEFLGEIKMKAGDNEISIDLNQLRIQGELLTETTFDGYCGASPEVCSNMTCGEDPTFGINCGQCDSGFYCVKGACEEGSPAQEACARFVEDRKMLYEGSWSGKTSTCNEGSIDADWQQRALVITNLYRWYAGLPPLKLNTALNAQQQPCALMMHANNKLSHNPGKSWKCYSNNGAEGAKNSNIATVAAVGAVDLYMIDPGNETTMGHRRWILSNWIGETAFGSTSKFSCMATLSGTGGTKANKEWTAWPPAGFYPMKWHSMSWTNTDKTGWSIQSDSINLSGAKVTITQNGKNKPVNVYALKNNYGSKYAINMIPKGWSTEANAVYKVQVTGISKPISYEVTTLDCSKPQ